MGVSVTRLRLYRLIAAMLIAMSFAVAPAYAQFSDGYKFLKAVREQDGQKVTEMLGDSASTLINTRDVSTGDSALHIVMQRRDTTWLNFLLSKGARPDIRDKAGNTPMLIAAQLGFADAIPALVQYKADVNGSNGRGETPLIIAVQRRDIAMVRQLVALGANPAQRDTVVGMSARDYAQRDARATTILKLLDEARPATPAKAMAGPKF